MIRVFGGLVELGEELCDRGGPETLEELVIFLGAETMINDVGGGAGLGDAVAHEGFAYERE